MELNLKKARKLEAKIQKYLDTDTLPTVITVRVMGGLEDAKVAIAKGNKEVREKLHEKLELIAARFEIRRQIEKQNEINGINGLMNERVRIQKFLEVMSLIVDTEALNEVELADKIQVQAEALKRPDNYESRTTLPFSVITEKEKEEFEDKHANMNKKLENIEDEISELNISCKIELYELSPDQIKLLQSKRLL